ncbi:uncharacterized protein [Coffea arabica]|uniref:Uncharacterized protein isoform X2 n=1 Tax=Coffea arabica TaxID=13443 RepID=A0ABM4UJX3_COFAR|nr:uncharacterized protein LOC113689813 isoform X2 [Coffea arabica]
MEADREASLNENSKKALLARSASHAQDELKSFRTWLKWMCVDQSDWWTAFLSWSVFVLSLSTLAALSFICLSQFVRKYGLRRFLFFDRLCDDSETVRKGYTVQLNRSLKIVFIFVIPCFTVECAYKIWWYSSGGTRIPFLGNIIVSDTVACILELCSWLYRTVVFFLVCILFRLICYLQILRLQDFAQVFQVESDVESVLREHLRIRRHLRIISHRYRSFILWALIIITVSQFASLLMTTRSTADLSIYKTGELALCSVSLLAGLMILLRSATRITHKAQAVTCLAAKWHVCATIDSFDTTEAETPISRVPVNHVFPVSSDGSDADDDVGDEEDDIDHTKLVPSYNYNTISFQKRQALVTYFENNRAGVTIYGFMLDRTSLHTIFGIELSLVLWLLGKTIGIS